MENYLHVCFFLYSVAGLPLRPGTGENRECSLNLAISPKTWKKSLDLGKNEENP